MIKDWQECGQALADVGKLEREIELLQLSLKERIADLQQQLETQQASLAAKRNQLLEEISDFAHDHRSDFQGKQSRKLSSGELGWRRSSKLDIADEATTLQRIKAFGLQEYLRVREEVDRMALKRAPAAHWEQLGISERIEESFYIKAK